MPAADKRKEDHGIFRSMELWEFDHVEESISEEATQK
jgi:hypothetical protein